MLAVEYNVQPRFVEQARLALAAEYNVQPRFVEQARLALAAGYNVQPRFVEEARLALAAGYNVQPRFVEQVRFALAVEYSVQLTFREQFQCGLDRKSLRPQLAQMLQVRRVSFERFLVTIIGAGHVDSDHPYRALLLQLVLRIGLVHFL